MQEDWVMLAVIGPPHGVSGRVKVKSFTEPMDAFAEHAALTYEDGTALTLTLTGHAQSMPVIAIKGITDRTQAERLRGKKIGVLRSVLPPLANPDEYYIDALIGMQVVDTNGRAFGEVVNVVNYGAGDILDILHTDRSEGMYAFNAATFPVLDTAARRLTIDPPLMIGDDELGPDESA